MPVQLRNRSGPSEPVDCSRTISFRTPATLNMDCDLNSSLLLTLPPEILTMIFEQAPLVDKVMLATSCKRMLAIGRLCKLSVPDRKYHGAPWSVKAVEETTGPCSCLHMEELLGRFRPRDVHGRPSRAWSWCVDCSMFRPTRRGWWTNELKIICTERQLHCAGPSINWYSRGLKRQCPRCWLHENEWDKSEDLGHI